MGFYRFLTRQRLRYSKDLVGDRRYWSLSALTLTELRAMEAVFPRYVKGSTLDVGAGTLNLKALVTSFSSDYTSLDIEKRHEDIDLVADAQQMTAVSDGSFHTVVCSQVLEHVGDPRKALAEIARVLLPGGHAVVSAPHLSALHEEPHDYLRFTPDGLASLMRSSGFEVLETRRVGGLFAFLSHPVSLVLISLSWGVPGLRWLAWAVNRVLIVNVSLLLDGLLGTARKYPAGTMVAGRKPR